MKITMTNDNKQTGLGGCPCQQSWRSLKIENTKDQECGEEI